MKYFCEFLMGQKKILMYFPNFLVTSFKSYWGLNTKCSNWPSRGFKKINDFKKYVKSNQAYDKCYLKIQKNKFWGILNPLLLSSSLHWGKGQLCLRILYLFDSIFQRWFGLISCIIFMKEFVSLTIVAMEIGKRQFLSYHSNDCYE